jgi:4-alpha-glucanotransferase
VAPGVRERLLAERILSTRVLWFEPGPPATYPPLSLAAVTTHDLPTVRGLWTGSDLREQQAVGLPPNVSGTEALRSHVRELTGLPGDAPPEAVTLALHRQLATAPSVLIAATLEDALGVAERPNLPGTSGDRRANWSLFLPEALEAIEAHPLPRALAAILGHRAS